MMAFFFTRPISSTMPMMEMTLRSLWNSMQGQHGAHAGRRQVEMMVSGCTRLSYKMPSTM